MNEITASSPANPRDKLVADLKLVISDAEELLRLTADQAGQKAAELRARMETRLKQARADLAHVQTMAVDRALDAGKAADDYVHARPWQAVGVAATLGFALGLLAARR